ncbi:MAG: YARHG domain-containing protein [Cellulosilyticum sp.]|nr:YARHG domain-containing protein [Cellulosilyticum sp.]
MRCNQCGTEITGDSKFCTRCGAPVIEEKQNTKQQNTKQQNTKQQSKGINGIIIGIVLILLVASGAFFYLVNERSHTKETFEKTVETYEKLLEEANLEEVKEYEELLVECEEVLSKHDKDMYPYLQEKLRKAMDEIEDKAEVEVTSLPDQDEPYKEKWEQLFTTEAENQEFTGLLEQLESAKKDGKTKTVEKASEEIEDLIEEIRKANQEELETRKSEVEKVVLSGMTKGEEVLIEGLKEELDKWCKEENYDEAFSTIQGWENFVDAFEKESEYKEQQEKEQKEKELELQEREQELKEKEQKQQQTNTQYRTQTYSNDFIIYDSNSRYLTLADIQGLSQYELLIARNEIYARHGRCFVDPNLQNYFNGKSWYYPSIAAADFTESMLSEVEKSNAYFIREYEQSKGYLK